MPMNKAIKTLKAVRDYAASQGVQAALSLHQEDSHLVRLANSGVSLNTSEALSRLSVTAYGDRKTASAQVMCDLDDQQSLFQAVDKAKSMLHFASPLTYQPTFPAIEKSAVSEQGYDERLAHISNEEILNYINTATQGLESDDVQLSGNFSVGLTRTVDMSTATEHHVAWQASDAQITLVLASLKDKWEINAEQSATRYEDLSADAMRAQLAYLKDKYQHCPAVQLPLGPYRVVFGPAAVAEYANFLTFLGTNGGMMKRDNSINAPEHIGTQRLNKQVTLWEDPACLDAFAIPVDTFGRRRAAKAWYDKGVFTGFIWAQQAADEHGEQPTGHDVMHRSFNLAGGSQQVNTLDHLQNMAKDQDVLYVPYLHYTGLVNASEGLITGTSRFGALLFKQDGTIQVPYNVRFTDKLGELFGDKLQWLSSETVPYNVSSTYDARNPKALVVPRMMCCDNVNVEISNKSY